MKKYILPLLSSFILLAGCTQNQPAVSSEEVSSSESSSIEETTSSSTSEMSENEKALNTLANKLLSLEGKVKSSTTTMDREFIYPGNGNFTMNVRNVYESNRYTHATSKFVVETNGTETYEGSTSSEYKTQIYDDGKKFYQITKYDGEDKTIQKSSFSEDSVESIYDIGPVQTEIANFNGIISNEKAMKAAGTPELFEWTFENIEGIEEDQYLKYSYTISIYEIQQGLKTLSTFYKYENTFTIEKDLITKLEQKYEMDQYVASATNTLKVSLETKYTQGDYPEFSGTLMSNKNTL